MYSESISLWNVCFQHCEHHVLGLTELNYQRLSTKASFHTFCNTFCQGQVILAFGMGFRGSAIVERQLLIQILLYYGVRGDSYQCQDLTVDFATELYSRGKIPEDASSLIEDSQNQMCLLLQLTNKIQRANLLQ